MNEAEEFRVIEGCDEYSVSSFGNIMHNTSGRIVRQYLNKNGYYQYSLTYPDGKTKHCRVHRLVAFAFIPNPENKPVVDHIDNNRANNNLKNLRWATYSENNMNTPLRITNKTGVKGVYYDKEMNMWRGELWYNKQRVKLGYFTSLEEAKEARQIKANELFGEFVNSVEKR